MIPILFDPGATDFSTHGIGTLRDAINCVVTEERNGSYELEMEYPITGAHYADIRHSAIIGAVPFVDGTIQGFRVYKISRPISGRVTINAQHISYQLSHIPVAPFSAVGCAAALNGFKSAAAEACPFTFETDIPSTSSYAVAKPGSIRSFLGGQTGSILDVFGGEYEFDNYTVRLHKSRGADKGIKIAYGKNLTDLTQEENIENTYTGLMPYWQQDDASSALVMLPEKVLHSANAANFPYQRTIAYNFSEKIQSQPTADQLRAMAKSYMDANGIGVPAVSLDVSFVDLSATEEYADVAPVETVNLCDTVTVEFPALGVSTKAKVNKTVYNVLLDRYDSISLGDARHTLSDTIEEQMGQIDAMATASQVQTAVDRATGALNSALRGHVIIGRNASGYANEILILDSDTIANAKNVIRINNAGIGFSTNGYGGPYTNAWTIDGELDADFIRAGTLSASRVRTGVMESNDGKMGIDLDNADISLEHSGTAIEDGETDNYTDICQLKDGSLTVSTSGTASGADDGTAYSYTYQNSCKLGDSKLTIHREVNGSDGSTSSDVTLKNSGINSTGNFRVNADGTLTLKGGKLYLQTTEGHLTIRSGDANKQGFTGTIGSAQYVCGICVGKA